MVTSWFVDPGCFRIAYINAKMIDYRPWLSPGCVDPNLSNVHWYKVIDPGYFRVAYTYQHLEGIPANVIDPGYFWVAYT